jgi:hypothetical protein
MACPSCQQKTYNGSGGQYLQPTLPQTCEYSLIRLNELLAVSQVNESNIIQSQINVYTVNCNMFRNVIIPLFTIYSIPLN